MAEETDAGEADSTTQVALCIVSGLLEVLRSVLRIRLSSAAFWFRVYLHLVRSAARLSQDAASSSSAFEKTSVDIVRVI